MRGAKIAHLHLCAGVGILPCMDFDLIQIRVLAKNKEDENWRFRQFLKTRCDLDLDEIDRLVFETTRRVWAGIDCTACANCCRQVHPSFSEEDVDRLARRFEIRTMGMIGRTFHMPDCV